MSGGTELPEKAPQEPIDGRDGYVAGDDGFKFLDGFANNTNPKPAHVMEYFDDLMNAKVEETNIWIDLACTNYERPREVLYALLCFVITIICMVLLPVGLIRDTTSEMEEWEEFCPNEANIVNKVGAWALMSLLYAQLGYLNATSLKIFVNDGYDVFESHTSYEKYRYIFTSRSLKYPLIIGYGCIVEIMCSSFLIPASTFYLFVSESELADLLLNAVAMTFLLEVPKIMAYRTLDDLFADFVDSFVEHGTRSRNDRYFKGMNCNSKLLAVLFACGVIGAAVLPVLCAICI